MLEHRERQGKSWLEGRYSETFFDGRIVGYVSKVPQCPTSVKNEKAYEYRSMNNIQLVYKYGVVSGELLVAGVSCKA